MELRGKYSKMSQNFEVNNLDSDLLKLRLEDLEDESRKNSRLNEEMEQLKKVKLKQEQEIESLSKELASKAQEIEKQKCKFSKYVKILYKRNKILASKIDSLKDIHSEKHAKARAIMVRAKIQITLDKEEKEKLYVENSKLKNMLAGTDVKNIE